MPMRNIKELKSSLRMKYRGIRENMDPMQKKEQDSAIAKRVAAIKDYICADIIFTYVSKPIEVDTKEIIRRAWQDGKRVAVPRCIPETYDMEFFEISSPQDLENGMFGVLEPIVQKCKKVTDFSKGFCIVPGMSFDTHGYRLGYGKGYYDRFLSNFGGFTVGICYSSCVQWNLPHGYFDRPVDILVTNKYLRRTSVSQKNPKLKPKQNIQ